jgi:antitoxin VapB
MDAGRPVKLFRNGRNQAVRIPVEFELPGSDAIIHKEGERLIIEPVRQTGLLEWLSSIEPWDESFPDVDDGQLPLEEMVL